MNILVVSSSSTSPLITLLKMGFPDARFFEARTRKRFREALKKELDGVVIDNYITWATGISVLKEIRKAKPFVPVVMLITEGTEEMAAEAMRFGLDEYVVEERLSALPAALKAAMQKEAVRRREAMLSSVVERAKEAVVTIDSRGRIIYANKATEKIFGWKVEELIGKSMAVMAVDPEEQRRQWKEAVDKGGAKFETVRKDKHGNPIPVLLTVVPFKDEKGNLLFSSAIITDIREIKEYQGKIEHLNELLRAIRGINQIITKEKDEGSLLKRACKLLYDVKGYEMVCILYNGKKFIEGNKNLYGRVERAFNRQGVKTIDGKAIVIKFKNVDGLLCVVHQKGFEKEEKDLLKEVASDISFAIHAIKMEREKKEVERKYHMIVETANEGICIDDAEEKIIFTNKAFANALGYRKKEMLNKNFLSLVYEEDRGKIEKEIEKRRKGKASRYEVRLLAKDGSIKTFFISALPLYEGKKFVGSISINMDITEQRSLEKKFEAVFEGALDAIFIEDLEGNILDANKAACDLLGYSKEELTKMNVRDIIPDEVKRRLEELVEEHLRKGGITVESANIHKSGKAIPVEVSTTLVDIGGEKRIVAIVRDIRQRKEMERQLKESEEKYRTLAENLPLGVFIGADRQIIYINEFGKEKIIRKNFPSLYEKFKKEGKIDLIDVIKNFGIGEKKIKMAIDKVVKGKPSYMEVITPAKNYISIRLLPFSYRGRKAILGMAEDVTDVRKKEKELKDTLKYLQRFHDATVGRELKMIELKKRLKECEKKLER